MSTTPPQLTEIKLGVSASELTKLVKVVKNSFSGTKFIELVLQDGSTIAGSIVEYFHNVTQGTLDVYFAHNILHVDSHYGA